MDVDLDGLDVFGDRLEGTVWTFPNQWGGEDKVVHWNLEMYLEQYMSAKRATVFRRINGSFYEIKAWTFPEDGYTVEEDDLEAYLLEWCGATKEYVCFR